MKCKAKTAEGKPCQSDGKYPDGKCPWHSNDPEAVEWRSKRNLPISAEKMIRNLERIAKKVERSERDPLAISAELRKIYELISSLRGRKPKDSEPGSGIEEFEKRVERTRKEIDDAKAS